MNKSARAAQRRRYLFISVVSPLLILAVWTLVAANGWVKTTLLPSPGMIIGSLGDMAVHGYAGVSLSAHIGTSLMRVLTAYVIGSVFGTIIGMLRGRVSWIDAAFLVPAEILRPMPPLGMIPLFILWLGIGELSKISLIFICVFLIMMVNAQAGASNCLPDSIRAAESLGASRRQVFLYVIFPSALPQIMTGLRIAMGSALSVLVASELLGGDRGLGFLVLDASNFFRTSYVFAGIIIIGMIGLISDRALAWMSRRVVHWQGSR